MNISRTLFLPGVIVLMFGTACVCAGESPRHTVVEIKGNKFFINGTPTFKGRTWEGNTIEGLLPNSRMVQGIFDDLSPETSNLWAYPDTKRWDPGRNTNEFVAAMNAWRSYGLLSFTINLQGGSPMGYGNKNWMNTAYFGDGSLRPEYLRRLEKILDRADELGMVPIVGLFYFGQDQYLKDEAAVVAVVDNVTGWLRSKGFRNVLIEIDNECNAKSYDHELLRPERVHELILRVNSRNAQGHRFYVSTSFTGNKVPTANVVAASDFILLHGNGISDPLRISALVRETRAVDSTSSKPILFNEDDHYGFDKHPNNFSEAVKSFASWGFFDYRRTGEEFADGYQCPPVDWGINSSRKKAFFNYLRSITGGAAPGEH
jgi:hypothetical protein